MKIEIRPACKGDHRDLVSVHFNSYVNVSKEYRAECMKYFPREYFEEKWEKNLNTIERNPVFIVRDITKNRVVGFVRIGGMDLDIYRHLDLELDVDSIVDLKQLYIIPEYQKYGIGKALSLQGMKGSLDMGYKHMVIFSDEKNQASHRFYRFLRAEYIDTMYDPVYGRDNTGTPVKIDTYNYVFLIPDLKEAYNQLRDRLRTGKQELMEA